MKVMQVRLIIVNILTLIVSTYMITGCAKPVLNNLRSADLAENRTLSATVLGDWTSDTENGRVVVAVEDCNSGEAFDIIYAKQAHFDKIKGLTTIFFDASSLEMSTPVCVKLKRLRMLFPAETNAVLLRNR